MEKRTVLVAMSGGVDSSVAAALLVEQGHRVIGVTMKTFCYSEVEGPSQTCCGLDGIMDARRGGRPARDPALRLRRGAGLHPRRDRRLRVRVRRGPHAQPVRALQREHEVPRPAPAAARSSAATPSPPGTTPAWAPDDAGEPRAAARPGRRTRTRRTSSGACPRELLPQLLFPLGELTKPEVRERARRAGLAHGGEAGEPGDLLRPHGDYVDVLEQRLGAGSPRPRPRPPGLDRRARRWASTRATPATPSGSAGGSAAGTGGASTCWARARPRARWWWGAGRSCTATSSAWPSSTGWPPRPPWATRCRCRSATAPPPPPRAWPPSPTAPSTCASTSRSAPSRPASRRSSSAGETVLGGGRLEG